MTVSCLLSIDGEVQFRGYQAAQVTSNLSIRPPPWVAHNVVFLHIYIYMYIYMYIYIYIYIALSLSLSRPPIFSLSIFFPAPIVLLICPCFLPSRVLSLFLSLFLVLFIFLFLAFSLSCCLFKPRLSPAATMRDATPSVLTPPLYCAILQPAKPPQIVAFES